MANFIITGGAGFIGSNIAEELVRQNHQVKIIDNLSTGNLNNLKTIMNRIKFIKNDISNLKILEKEFQGADYVLHQAALCSVPRSINDPLSSHTNNINGTLNVLLAAKEAKIKRVVMASSSSVYGETKTQYKSEKLPPSPLTPYALNKLTGEIYGKIFYQIYGLKTISLRYFNVFGPKQDPNSEYAAVIPKFINLMLNGKRPIIFGDGQQARDFTYIQNNVQANILAATAKQGIGEIFNIACGKSITLNELVQVINLELGTNIQPIYRKSRIGDIKMSKANINKAKKTIGYHVKVHFRQGLKETIKWYKNQNTTQG